MYSPSVDQAMRCDVPYDEGLPLGCNEAGRGGDILNELRREVKGMNYSTVK